MGGLGGAGVDHCYLGAVPWRRKCSLTLRRWLGFLLLSSVNDKVLIHGLYSDFNNSLTSKNFSFATG